MVNTKAANRYASAIFDIAKEKNILDVVLSDLNLVKNTINSSNEFNNLLLSPVVNIDKKTAIFKEIFESQLNELSFQFLVLLIKKKRDFLAESIVNEFINLFNKEKNLTPIEVYSAIELDDAMKSSIENKIASAMNLNVISNFKVDKKLKGGIKIQINDWVYDASIKSKLEAIKVSLITNIN